MKKKEKRTKHISKKVEGRIPNRKIRNCLYFDANLKWILQAKETNHNHNDFKSKPHFFKEISE